MKRLFTLLALTLPALSAMSQTITWGTPVTVTTGTGANLHPRISLNRTGSPYVLWGKTDTKAYFSKWNGTGFTTPVAVSGGINVFAQSWAGPDMAAFGDTIYVSMKRTPETMNMNHMYLVHSYDGGMNFSDTVKIDNIDTSMSRFPVVTTTITGNPQVAFMKFNSAFADAQYAVTTSSDYGMTFSPDALASTTPGEVCDCCPATILSSGTNTMVLFRNNLSNIRDIWVGLSNNSGTSFYNNRVADTSNWMIMSCPSSGPDGFVLNDSLYTVFMSSASGMPYVYLSKTNIATMTAVTAQKKITGMFTGLSSQNYPRIANAGNAAVAVWKQNTSSGNGIAYSFTSNILGGLSGYTNLPGATGSGVMNADVAMKNGEVHIVWEDDNTGKVMYIKGTYTPVSVANISRKEMISVYPNPAKDNFTVPMGKINTITYAYLTDNMGRNIALAPSLKNGTAVFAISGIATGAYYFVMGDDAGKTYYSKLIVE